MRIFASVEMEVKFSQWSDAMLMTKEVKFNVGDDALIDDVVRRAKTLARLAVKSPVMTFKMKDVTLFIKEGE